MTLHELMDYLDQIDISLTVAGGRLRCVPRSAITTQIEAEIRTHKSGLIANLRPDTDPNKSEIQKAAEREGAVPVDDGVNWGDGLAPVTCDKCGGIDTWRNVHGEPRCTKCDPSKLGDKWLQGAARDRRLNPAPKRDELSIEEKTQRKSLCSPIQKREDTPGCPRCRSTEYTDVEIHEGRSLRRDCVRCELGYKFSRWHKEDRP
jgi:hypothetical protein